MTVCRATEGEARRLSNISSPQIVPSGTQQKYLLVPHPWQKQWVRLLGPEIKDSVSDSLWHYMEGKVQKLVRWATSLPCKTAHFLLSTMNEEKYSIHSKLIENLKVKMLTLTRITKHFAKTNVMKKSQQNQ